MSAYTATSTKSETCYAMPLPYWEYKVSVGLSIGESCDVSLPAILVLLCFAYLAGTDNAKATYTRVEVPLSQFISYSTICCDVAKVADIVVSLLPHAVSHIVDQCVQMS